MNNFPLFDQSLILQQQLLLQQMLIYNQMLAQKARMLSKPINQQPLVQKSVDDNELSSPSFSKHDDTHPIQQIPQISKKIEKKTLPKKAKQANKQNSENKEPSQKKKIFLSMLDIKEAQYKKFKTLDAELEIQPINVVRE